MRDSNIVTLCKCKGDRSDCNNYRGISLLIIVGKVFARVVLSRLQVLASIRQERNALNNSIEQGWPVQDPEEDWLPFPPPPPRLLNIIASFHDGMQGTASYNGASSEPFKIKFASLRRLCPASSSRYRSTSIFSTPKRGSTRTPGVTGNCSVCPN